MRLVVGPTRMAFQGLANTTSTWFEEAACRGVDVEVFFATPGVDEGRSTYREARSYCAVCPVVEQCLDYALDNHIMHGYFGDATERERREMRRRRTS